MATAFHGWSDAAFDFYRRLAEDNSREFWATHRETYETEVREPFDALNDLVADEFGPLHIPRPQRDLRFSRDKTPYKTRCYGLSRAENGTTFYLEVAAHGIVAGAGYWAMARDQLTRYRASVADDRSGPALQQAVTTLRDLGLDLEGQPLKTAPRGYRRDHPRIDLLRCKSLAGLRSFPPGPWAHSPAAAERIVEVWRATAPLTGWLSRHVGPSTEPPRTR